ncbi:VOC family protein [Microbacterium sp. NPDC077057]|uniref:VOC family protein n=1 Tax=unclassified Microbacterium TaxID=2609290 RepID=UPI00341C967F
MTDQTPPAGVTGAHTTDGRPHSATSLTPFLAIPDAARAVEFYRDVFGARVVDVTEFGGTVAHADLDFGLGRLQLGEPSPEYHLVPAPSGDDDCYSMGLYVPDVDAVVARAVAAGGDRPRGAVPVRLRRPLREHPRPVRRAVVDHDARGGSVRRGERPTGGRVGCLLHCGTGGRRELKAATAERSTAGSSASAVRR